MNQKIPLSVQDERGNESTIIGLIYCNGNAFAITGAMSEKGGRFATLRGLAVPVKKRLLLFPQETDNRYNPFHPRHKMSHGYSHLRGH